MTSTVQQIFENYCDRFEKNEMLCLKHDHTLRVVQNARKIMEGHADIFTNDLPELAVWAAFMHDVGRFEQYKKYKTFSDLHSVNHALSSISAILHEGWLDDMSPRERNLILRAVEFHNMKTLPEGLSYEENILAKLVRDADKLDIFTILDQAIKTDYLPKHPDVYWNLPFSAPPNPAVITAMENGKSVDYSDIHSFCDFVLIQISWMNGGLYFPQSYSLIAERHELEIREKYLCEIIPESEAVIRKLCLHISSCHGEHKIL